MARGDVTVFNEAKQKMLEGGWDPTDHIYCAVCDNTTTPAAGTATPTLSDFTEVGSGGSYVAGGADLGLMSDIVQSDGGTGMKFDSAINPNWAQNAGNDNDAFWGIIYNYTTGDAIAFVDLGGPVDMGAGALTITWNANGMFTID
jgi:hypothetical protein